MASVEDIFSQVDAQFAKPTDTASVAAEVKQKQTEATSIPSSGVEDIFSSVDKQFADKQQITDVPQPQKVTALDVPNINAQGQAEFPPQFLVSDLETIKYGNQDQHDATNNFISTLGTNYRIGLQDVFEEQMQKIGREYKGADALDFKLNPLLSLTDIVRHVSNIVDGEGQTASEFGSAMESGAQTRKAKLAQESAVSINPDSLASETAASAGQSLGQMTGAVAVGMGNVPRTLAAMYYTTASQAENQALDSGASPLRARLYGQVQGIIEAATEAWPTAKLLEGGLFSPIKKKVGEFLLRELPSEMSATLLQDLSTKLQLNPNMTWGEFGKQLGHDLIITALTTPVAGGLQVGAVNALGAGAAKAKAISDMYQSNLAAERKNLVINALQDQRQQQIDKFMNDLLQSGQQQQGDLVAYHATQNPTASIDNKYIAGQSGDVHGLQLSSDPNVALRGVELKRGLKQDKGPPPKVVPVNIPNEEEMLNAEQPVSKQSDVVKQILEANGMSSKSSLTGREFYQRLVQQTGNAEAASEYLSKIGIKGMKFDRVVNTEAGRVPFANYSIFSPSNVTAVEVGAKLIEMNASEAKLAGVKQAVREVLNNPPDIAFQQKVHSLYNSLAFSKAQSQEMNADLTKFNWLINWTAGLDIIGKLNAHVPGVTNYVQAVHDWWALKSHWTDRADVQVKQWQQAVRSREAQKELDVLMSEADQQSEKLQRKLTAGELQKIITDNKLSSVKAEQLTLADKVWQDYRDSFSAVEEQVVGNIARTVENEFARNAQIAEVRKTFDKIRDGNYLPRSSFGKYSIEVKAAEDTEYAGKEYTKGETLWFSTHATKSERDAAVKKLDGELQQHDVTTSILTDRQRMYQGIPDAFLTKLEEVLQLDESQIAELQVLKAEQSPMASSMRKLLNRVKAEGYSKDSLRNYAEYFGRFSNHIARLTYDERLRNALAEVSRSVTGDMTKRAQLAEWMKKHRDYLNNPGNEFATLRSLGFLLYIGAVPKSAFMNLTQLPLVSLPYLSQRFEQNSAIAALSKAINDHAQFWKKGSRYSPGEAKMIEQLRGLVLNESQATELGAIAAGNQIERIILGQASTGYQSRTRRGMRKTVNSLAWMFQQTEIANRHITALATYNLATKAGQSHEQAVNEALKAVRSTQFEYARYNRPQLIRGKKSALFLFQQYTTSMLWFLGTEPSAWRVIAMMFGFAGALGLPFAENAADFYDFLMTKLKTLGGIKDPKTQIRRDMRDYLESVFEDPPQEVQNLLDRFKIKPSDAADMVLHGLSRDLANTDVSGSASMGRVLPGTDILSQEMSPEKAATQSLKGAGGALGAWALGLYQAVTTSSTDKWKTWEKVLPAEARNISRAARWATRGQETDSTGKTIAYFDPKLDWPLLVGQAAGFAPSKINERNERLWETRDAIEFYRSYQQTVMRKMYDVIRSEDRDKGRQIAEMQQAYNAIVPYPEMKITGQMIHDSIKKRMKDFQYNEAGTIQERKYRRLYTERVDTLGEPLTFGNTP